MMPSLRFLQSWPHECCYPLWCYYRAKNPSTGLMECHSSCECDYQTAVLLREAQQQKEQRAADAANCDVN